MFNFFRKKSKKQEPEQETSFISTLDSGKEIPNQATTMSAAKLAAILEQAEMGDPSLLFALYRDVLTDNHVASEYTKRKASILGDTVSFQSGESSPGAEAARSKCAKLAETAVFSKAVSHLLNATLFPVAVLQKVYRPSGTGFELADLVPVHYQLLDYSTGELRIKDVDPVSRRPLNSTHRADPNIYIVHRSTLLPNPDNWGGAMRGILFWWLFKNMDRQWWASLLERFGIPFMVGKGKTAEDRNIMKRAFQWAVKLGGLVVSPGAEVQLIQAAQSDTGNSHKMFIELCNAEISKLIIGQTLSSTPAATGLGSGVAALQGEVRDDLRKLDAKALAQTLHDQLFIQYLQINGIDSSLAPIVVFGSDSAQELASLMGTLSYLTAAGLEVDDEALETLSMRLGFSVRRKEVAAMPGQAMIGLSAPAAHVTTTATALEEALKEDSVLIQAIVESSTSEEDCMTRLEAFLAKHHPAAAKHLEEIMKRYADSSAY